MSERFKVNPTGSILLPNGDSELDRSRRYTVEDLVSMGVSKKSVAGFIEDGFLLPESEPTVNIQRLPAGVNTDNNKPFDADDEARDARREPPNIKTNKDADKTPRPWVMNPLTLSQKSLKDLNLLAQDENEKIKDPAVLASLPFKSVPEAIAFMSQNERS